MRKTAVIIVNPASGKGAALAKAGKACAILKKGGVKAGLFRTGGPGHGRELAKKFAATADVLVSVGGDGTLNEVVNGVIDARSGTPIAMVARPTWRPGSWVFPRISLPRSSWPQGGVFGALIWVAPGRVVS